MPNVFAGWFVTLVRRLGVGYASNHIEGGK